MSPLPFRTRPLVALRALVTLARNPDDLPKVFTVIEALPGRSPMRMTARLRATPSGRRLLAARPDLKARLADREALRALPEGSLGRAYLAFVERTGISAEGIVSASEAGTTGVTDLPADIAYYGDRMRDTHDLWHVVTGYGADLFGETALLAFSFAQTRHPGVALITSLAIWKGLPGVRSAILGGYRRGLRAEWLPGVEWEELLARPLGEVRAALRIDVAPAYTPVTSDELRETGKLSAREAA
ncbi:MAG: hypothetical protein JST00_11375 [Deltaproteobacteria bacterium]|nr:hypothetical protein [Deltaproteobacteria bacterium]